MTVVIMLITTIRTKRIIISENQTCAADRDNSSNTDSHSTIIVKEKEARKIDVLVEESEKLHQIMKLLQQLMAMLMGQILHRKKKMKG